MDNGAEPGVTAMAEDVQGSCVLCGGPPKPASIDAELATAIFRISTELAAVQQIIAAQGQPSRRPPDAADRPHADAPPPRERGTGESSGEVPPETHQLTARECEILTLVALGKSNRAVGRALRIAEKTVKNHLYSIFVKLGVADRTEAVVAGIRLGLVSLESALRAPSGVASSGTL